MRIESFFNTTSGEIDSKRWNPYLGISINNKAFTVEYLAEFMNWATERARERAAIVIVDIIQHINNEVLDKKKPQGAIEKAFRKADEVHLLCDQAMSTLSPERRDKLIVLEWTDLVYESGFRHNLSVLRSEYTTNRPFREALQAIVRDNLGPIVQRLDDAGIERLTHYVLNELPELIAGFRHEGVHFNLNVYPGKIGSIYMQLLEFGFFRQLLPKLHLSGEIASVEAYGSAPHV
ncbi:MAG: tRNA-dependent cyclodipeptide synthase [Spartobacteria bacterium]|nr:tRNA-dependent cyclodipeptide synthase [Spartobacteria bacterium]